MNKKVERLPAVGMPKSLLAACFRADSETSQQVSGGQCTFLRKTVSGAGKPGAT